MARVKRERTMILLRCSVQFRHEVDVLATANDCSAAEYIKRLVSDHLLRMRGEAELLPIDHNLRLGA